MGLADKRKAVYQRSKAGPKKSLKGVQDKKLKRNLRQLTVAYEKAAEHAAKAEILLPSEAGYLEADGNMERTWRFKQQELKEHVDLQTELKSFSLKLDKTGPYRCSFSHNGKHLLAAGRRGHVAAVEWKSHNLLSELQLRDRVKDAIFLHDHTLYATAQQKYVYMYETETTAEVHCMRSHFDVTRLAFLRYHFLLVTINTGGILRYQDTSTGAAVAEHRTKMGSCSVMRPSPYNAMMHLGHTNGTVTMWSPNMGKPAVKMLTHKGGVTALAMDRTGRHMVTSGLDGQLKVWDLRTYKMTHAYRTASPAVSLDISDRGLLALAHDRRVQVWAADAITSKAQAPYMNHVAEGTVENVAFCPYEDVLGIAHARGFDSMLVPGSGEPNFDSLEANPYETQKQRAEREVHSLLEKLPPDTIVLDPTDIGRVRPSMSTQQNQTRTVMALANNKKAPKQSKKMKGKGTASKRVRRKQTNVIDAKHQLAKEAKALREEKARKKKKEKGQLGLLDQVLSRFE